MAPARVPVAALRTRLLRGGPRRPGGADHEAEARTLARDTTPRPRAPQRPHRAGSSTGAPLRPQPRGLARFPTLHQTERHELTARVCSPTRGSRPPAVSDGTLLETIEKSSAGPGHASAALEGGGEGLRVASTPNAQGLRRGSPDGAAKSRVGEYPSRMSLHRCAGSIGGPWCGIGLGECGR